MTGIRRPITNLTRQRTEKTNRGWDADLRRYGDRSQNNLKINREWTRIDANKKNNPQITENLRHHFLFGFIRVHPRLNISSLARRPVLICVHPRLSLFFASVRGTFRDSPSSV